MDKPLLIFKPKLPRLSSSESTVLKLLTEAGKLIVPIYQQQETQPNFSKQDLEKAAKSNPQILSPFTVVEKVGGSLVATPYHVKYADLLKPIAEKLEHAANLTDNKEFGKALKIQAKALMEGIYEEAIAAWLKIKPYILDISIGPLNHFDERVFFGKASYQSWVGVVDKAGTERLNNYKSITLSARRQALVPNERIDNLEGVKARTIDLVLVSGLMARTKYVGLSLPMDVRVVEKYGSEVVMFNQLNELRLKEQILPTFNKIFSSAFKEGFSTDDLSRGYMRAVALHELAHSFLYYKNSFRNLQDLFPAISELAAMILGLRMAGSLLLKDRITNKQLESMMVAFTSRSYYLMERRKIDKSFANYALGSSVFINFMKESGALKSFDGSIVLNFTKMFVSLHDLSLILERLLAEGTRKDAETFIKKYEQIGR